MGKHPIFNLYGTRFLEKGKGVKWYEKMKEKVQKVRKNIDEK